MIGKLKQRKSLVILISILSLAVILGVVLSLVFSAQSQKSVAAIGELSDISTAIRNNYRNNPSYWGLDSSYAATKILPERHIKDGKIYNLFGKDVLIGYDFDATALMPGSRTFDVVYKALDRDECVIMLSNNFNEELNTSLVLIRLKNEDIVREFSWGGENTLPVSANIAKRYCKKQNDILWQFE